MNISNLNKLEFTDAYGIFCASSAKQNDRNALYPTFCKIPVAGKTLPHSHFEAEVFYVISGIGLFLNNGQSRPVKSGDLIRIPPYSDHQLQNLGKDELQFLSIYSEDFEVSPLAPNALITVAPPTPNGPLHLGHISGPYLASDVLSRYLRIRLSHVHSHSGTDDHQNYVSERAKFLELPTDFFRNQMRSRISAGLAKMQINFDEFIEPKVDLDYQRKIQNFAKRAIEQGLIEKENIELPFCNSCDHFLIDALIDAICPICENSSRGGCEHCGVVIPPQDLVHAKCSRCGDQAGHKCTDVFTFSLSRHLPLIEAELENLNLSSKLKNIVTKVQALKNLKVLVSHPDKEGFGIQLSDTNQTLHVWFEMAAHYEDFALSESTWIHFFGFDNSFHYLLFIPALLRAMNPIAQLPKYVFANEFLLLYGLKFSTSRNHAIWADEFTGHSDYLRIYLCKQRPANHESNFENDKFDVFSTELDEQMQKIKFRAQRLGPKSKFIGRSSAPARVQIESNRLTRNLELVFSPHAFDLRQAARLILSFIDFTLEHLQKDTEEISGERLLIATLATAISPIMPMASTELLSLIGIESITWHSDWGNVL